ncbi:MAG: hypothetical protein KC657_13705 [Myxococcales bacterium]|nr:hypothetical protein [Myxococcales bacterium]
MDAVPIEGAVEIREAACADANAAKAALLSALARVRAPSRGAEAPWRVEVSFAQAPRGTRADASILDGRGEQVAVRSLTAGGRACAGLSKAVGAWASLVADAELERAAELPAAPPPTPETKRATVHVALGADGFIPRVPGEAPDRDVPIEGPAARPVELGAGGVWITGHGVGPLAGGAAFATIGVGGSWLARATGTVAAGVEVLSPAGARPISPSGSGHATLFGARLDLCRRIPGNYIERRGIQLDLCFGADTAALVAARQESADGGAVSGARSSEVIGRLGVGPGVDLRGELGGGIAVELRGETALAVVRSELFGSSPAVATAAGLLGLSWRLQ